jgi:hypothetical protein
VDITSSATQDFTDCIIPNGGVNEIGPMRGCFQLFAVIIGFCCHTCCTADDQFYRKFLSVTDTNQTRAIPLGRLLVDTNNTESKLTNVLLNLDEVRSTGEYAGLRLGMTMGDVITRWGKPCGGCSNGCVHGLTTFFFGGEIALGFEADSLETIWIVPGFFATRHEFGGGLIPESKAQDFVRVLGQPTSRTGDPAHNLRLVYESSKATIVMIFHEEELMSIYIERSSNRIEPSSNLKLQG